jgi:hypothetical protein
MRDMSIAAFILEETTKNNSNHQGHEGSIRNTKEISVA